MGKQIQICQTKTNDDDYFLFNLYLRSCYRDFQHVGGVRHGDPFPPHKYIKNNLHVEQLLQNTFWTLEEDPRLSKGKLISTEWGRAKYI